MSSTAPPTGRVVLRLRGPGEETTSDLPVELNVEAGQTVSLIALIRNETGIREQFRVSVDGLPDRWWSVEREVAQLKSFDSGKYETELVISIHPPRTAHPRAELWKFDVVASAVAQPFEARATAWVDVTPTESAPPTASARGYLRDGMPMVYRENDFAMRFLHALEEVLDPIVAFLDALPAHIDVALAPAEFVTLIGQWLGVDPEGRWEGLLGRDEDRRRALVSRATEIARGRGTSASMQLVLDLLFPDLGLRVRDFGRSTFSAEQRDPPVAEAAFEVVSALEPARARLAAIDRVVEQLRPVHVKYKGLRVEEAPA